MTDNAERPYEVGSAKVTRVIEQYGLGFSPAYLFPDWQDAALVEHRR